MKRLIHLFVAFLASTVFITAQNISVDSTAKVPEILSVDATDVTATIAWQSSYKVTQISCNVAEVYSPEPIVTVQNAVQYTLTDLSPMTGYVVQIRGLVSSQPDGDNVYTDWSERRFFVTDEYGVCAVPGDLRVDMTKFHDDGIVSLLWNSAADQIEWDVEYRNESVEDWNDIAGLDVCYVEIPNLPADQVFFWAVRAKCTSDRESDWSENHRFRTGEIEYEPDGISVARSEDIKVEIVPGAIVIYNTTIHINSVEIYDIGGRCLKNVNVNGAYSLTIPVDVTPGPALLRVMVNNKTIDYKIFIR